MVDKEGREAELLELQKAEEAHRELLLRDRDERNKIAKDLHSLRRCGGGACRLEDAEVARGLSRKQVIVRERLPVARREKHSHCSHYPLISFRLQGRGVKACAHSLGGVNILLNGFSDLATRTPQTR